MEHAGVLHRIRPTARRPRSVSGTTGAPSSIGMLITLIVGMRSVELRSSASSLAIASPRASGRATGPGSRTLEDPRRRSFRPANRPGRGRRRQTVHGWPAPVQERLGGGVRRASSTNLQVRQRFRAQERVGEASACKPPAAPREATVPLSDHPGSRYASPDRRGTRHAVGRRDCEYGVCSWRFSCRGGRRA